MTRGKYGARADRRREDASITDEIAGYQHQIRRLTQENQQLRDKLSTGEAASKQEIRRLSAQVAEGVSAELLAVRAELKHQRDQADQAARNDRSTAEKWHRAANMMIAWFCDAYRCTPREAMEVVMALLGGLPDMVLTSGQDERLLGKEPNEEDLERVRTIQAARGFRKPHLELGEKPSTRLRPSAGQRQFDRWRES